MLRNTRISSREKVEPFVTVECAKCNSKGQDAIAPFRNFEIAVSYWETRRADCMGSNRFAFFVIERLLQLWRRSVLRDIHHDADVADHEVDDPSLLWASSELPNFPLRKLFRVTSYSSLWSTSSFSCWETSSRLQHGQVHV